MSQENRLREKIGQTVIHKASPKELGGNISLQGFLEKNAVGAIFVGAEVIKEAVDGVEAIKAAILSYAEASKVPLLFVSDLENGCGSMINGLTPLPYLMGLGAANDEKLAYAYGKATALEARSVGIQWSFSPIVDLNTNPRNPLVNVRAISDHPDIAIPLLKNVIRGMQEHGLGACAKHFPGDGDDWRDQHIVTTQNSLSMEEWYKLHGRVFEEMIQEGVYSIMAGHITLPAYPQQLFEGRYPLPATLSYDLLSTLLRKEMGYKGLIVSDALGMGGYLGWYDRERAELECFKAGCDMLLWPTDKYVDNMVEAVNNQYITEKQIDASLDRILELKQKTGVLEESKEPFIPLSQADREFVLKNQEAVAQKSITLVCNEQNLIPLSSEQKRRILLVGVTHYEPAWKQAELLKERLCERGEEVDLREYIGPVALEEAADSYDLVIFALFSRSLRPIGPIDFYGTQAGSIWSSLTAAQEKTVIVSFGSPYFKNQYFERSKTYINGYSMLSCSVEAFVKALYGEVECTTFSPVKI